MNNKKNEIKLVIGIIIGLCIFLITLAILLILFLKKDKYIGTWYMTEIYNDEKIITIISIKKNKKAIIKEEYKNSGKINIYKGKWKLDKDSLIINTNDDWEIELYVKDNNTLCLNDKECNESEKFHRKRIINLKEYYYIYDEYYSDNYDYGYYEEDDYDDYDDEYDDDTPIKPVMTKKKEFSFDSDYDEKEDKNKVPVIVFYGEGCPHCEELFEGLDSLDKSIKDMFVVKIYEVWYNKDNFSYLNRIADFRDDEVGGVPYVIIGDKSWNGFTDNNLKEMVEEIKRKPTTDIEKDYNNS